MSGISGFSFWAIEPIRKDGNGGKLRKSHFSGKRINVSEMLFHESELILKTMVTWYDLFGSLLEFGFLKSFINLINWQRKFEVFKNLKISGVSVFLFRAIELKSMWQISWKILVYFVLGQVKSFKIKYLAYQRESLRVWQVKFKVLKDLKLSSISDFCYELQSQFKKTETTGKWQSGWILNFLSGVSFLRLLMLCFRCKQLLYFGLIFTFRHFRCFRRFRRINLATSNMSFTFKVFVLKSS